MFFTGINCNDQIFNRSWGELEEDARKATTHYLFDAVREIDICFGEGFAKKNPGLVGDYMKAAATESLASTTAYQAQAIKKIADSMSTIYRTNSDDDDEY